jgi:hypothetical protein
LNSEAIAWQEKEYLEKWRDEKEEKHKGWLTPQKHLIVSNTWFLLGFGIYYHQILAPRPRHMVWVFLNRIRLPIAHLVATMRQYVRNDKVLLKTAEESG